MVEEITFLPRTKPKAATWSFYLFVLPSFVFSSRSLAIHGNILSSQTKWSHSTSQVSYIYHQTSLRNALYNIIRTSLKIKASWRNIFSCSLIHISAFLAVLVDNPNMRTTKFFTLILLVWQSQNRSVLCGGKFYQWAHVLVQISLYICIFIMLVYYVFSCIYMPFVYSEMFT